MARLLVLLATLLLISSNSARAQSDEEALRSELAKVVESLNSGGGSAALDFFSDHYVAESTRFHLAGTRQRMEYREARRVAKFLCERTQDGLAGGDS